MNWIFCWFCLLKELFTAHVISVSTPLNSSVFNFVFTILVNAPAIFYQPGNYHHYWLSWMFNVVTGSWFLIVHFWVRDFQNLFSLHFCIPAVASVRRLNPIKVSSASAAVEVILPPIKLGWDFPACNDLLVSLSLNVLVYHTPMPGMFGLNPNSIQRTTWFSVGGNIVLGKPELDFIKFGNLNYQNSFGQVLFPLIVNSSMSG